MTFCRLHMLTNRPRSRLRPRGWVLNITYLIIWSPLTTTLIVYMAIFSLRRVTVVHSLWGWQSILIFSRIQPRSDVGAVSATILTHWKAVAVEAIAEWYSATAPTGPSLMQRKTEDNINILSLFNFCQTMVLVKSVVVPTKIASNAEMIINENSSRSQS